MYAEGIHFVKTSSGIGRLVRESDNSPKFSSSGGSHDTQSGTELIDWALD